MVAWRPVLFAAALSLAAENNIGCALDQAQVSWIPPATFQVLATYSCAETQCIERWIEVDGQPQRRARVCEAIKASDTLAPSGTTTDTSR